MKRPLLTCSLVIALGILGTVGVRHEARIQLDRAISRFRATLPPDASFTYSSATPHILTRGAEFRNVRYMENGTVLTAATLYARSVSGNGVTGTHLGVLRTTSLTVSRNGSNVIIDDARVADLNLPPARNEGPDGELSVLWLMHFRNAAIAHLNLQTATPACNATIADISVENYGLHEGSDYAMNSAALHCALPPRTPRPGAPPVKQAPLDVRLSQIGGRNVDLALTVQQLSAILTKKAEFAPVMDSSKEPAKSSMTVSGLDFRQGVAAFAIASANIESRLEGHESRAHMTVPDFRLLINGKPAMALLGGGLVGFTADAVSDNRTGASRSTYDVTLGSYGKFSFLVDLVNAPHDGESADPSHQNTAIAKMTFAYTDASLIERAFRQYAEKTGTPEDQLRQRATLLLTLTGSQYAALQPLGDYIQSPSGRAFTLSFQPPSPLKIVDLATKISLPDAALYLQPPILTSSVQ
ncbi:hypothetical protein [Brytella acorum]|uniref:Uncharacterized protein n=1 Tax=Brytella acorum TaxID=2959299 RepID=A0AA35Y0R3_9PROT|nr:hypothetical protein [Brytella acorum]MDF3623695.1 hypothetical protein [Brytella acorum]CAI9119887.1 hypothetical protein LMG32879_000713 [Brytella acorum]